jgi:hypothetical protein
VYIGETQSQSTPRFIPLLVRSAHKREHEQDQQRKQKPNQGRAAHDTAQRAHSLRFLGAEALATGAAGAAGALILADPDASTLATIVVTVAAFQLPSVGG